MRWAAGIEYDGRAFHGWQAQPHGVRTVQACVEQALGRIADHPLAVQCAGRTDVGVHACGQVVHFDSPARRTPHAWVMGANSLLPADVALRWAVPVGDDFHARFSALGRRYRYLLQTSRVRSALWGGRVTCLHHGLQLEPMQAAAALLRGEHDFSAFRAQGCQARSPVRHLRELTVVGRGGWIVIEAEANAFLHHMVRNLVGVLVAIGSGERPVDWARQVLEGRDRRLGGVTAPADGLYLVAVQYALHWQLPAVPELAPGGVCSIDQAGCTVTSPSTCA